MVCITERGFCNYCRAMTVRSFPVLSVVIMIFALLRTPALSLTGFIRDSIRSWRSYRGKLHYSPVLFYTTSNSHLCHVSGPASDSHRQGCRHEKTEEARRPEGNGEGSLSSDESLPVICVKRKEVEHNSSAHYFSVEVMSQIQSTIKCRRPKMNSEPFGLE